MLLKIRQFLKCGKKSLKQQLSSDLKVPELQIITAFTYNSRQNLKAGQNVNFTSFLER